MDTPYKQTNRVGDTITIFGSGQEEMVKIIDFLDGNPVVQKKDGSRVVITDFK